MTMNKKTKLHCVFLITRGEIVEGSQELNRLGYDVETYPTTQDISCLRDTVDTELSSIFPWKYDLDTPYARSLRSSFVRMILDPRFADDDFIIFGESDATPVTEAEKLYNSLAWHMSCYPETDIFRLFHDKQVTCPAEPSKPEAYQFIPLPPGTRSKLNTSVWGTHALVIPSAKRRKIADIFLNYRLPTDNALEAACYRKELIMRIAGHNHFYQKPRTFLYDKTVSYACRERKIALCLAITRKEQIENLYRQIESFMHQSYRSFHIFVAVSGITEEYFHRYVIPHVFHGINEELLTLRLFPDSNQATAFANTVRNMDISGYELFVRLNPSENYHIDILSFINAFHTGMPQFYSSYFEQRPSHQSITFTLQPRAMGAFMDFERNPESIPGLIPAIPPEQQNQYKNTPELLLDNITSRLGRRNMTSYLEKLSQQIECVLP